MSHSNFEELSFHVPDFEEVTKAKTTGRHILVFRKHDFESSKKISALLNRVAGIKNVVSAADFEDSAIDPESADEAGAIFLPILGAAVVSADANQIQALASGISDKESEIAFIEPERMVYPLSHQLSRGYIHGYRDAVNDLCDQLLNKYFPEDEIPESAFETFQDTAEFTWGLQATRVNTSPFSGRGVRVAVLDTGFDLKHPDFKGREITAKSFVSGESPQDGHGHGTHCTGTACGPRQASKNRRGYGCAYQAEIFIGKVLSNSGSGSDGGILQGMEWAIANACQVVSMSLGGNQDLVISAYETAAKRALEKGCLIVAAAGNNARRRQGYYGFVATPANSLSIMAIGAVDNRLQIADFSARSSAKTGVGGKVDIVAPGVNVYSSSVSANGKGGYDVLSGTSMATPHVAGIAALWIESEKKTGSKLWTTLLQNSRRIPGDVRDIGSGLVLAPQ